MGAIKGTFNRGLMLGDKPQLNYKLRNPTAGDIIDAHEASEKAVLTKDGYQMISSPALMGAELLCRQMLYIGDIKGPLELFQLKMLSAKDLNKLNISAEQLDQAAFAGPVVTRGRDERGSNTVKDSATAAGPASPLDETRPLPD